MVRPTPEQIDEAVNRRLAFLDFWEFCLYYDREFFTRRPFLKKVADKLQWLFEEYIAGRSRRISVSLPPRSGKSYITSLFCAWWIGRLPEKCIMRNSATATLYRKLSRHVRNFIKDPRYTAVFPSITLSKDNQALDNWSVEGSRQGSYFGGGVDTNIIGNGANLSINDDLYPSITHALNEDYNDKVHEWKESTADSRKETGCPEIYIGTRWRIGDVIGKAIDSGKIDQIVSQPALIDNPDEDEREIEPMVSFCEDVRTTEEYLETKRDIDETIWDAEYMQAPSELKGALFPPSELRFYNPAEVDVPKLAGLRHGAVDPSDQGDDDYAATAGYLIISKVDDSDYGEIYLHDVLFNQDGMDLNEPATIEFIKRNKLTGIDFEGNNAYHYMGKTIRKKTSLGGAFRIFNSTSNKHMRILAEAGKIKNYVRFRSDWDSLPQYRRFMKQLTNYMKDGSSAHDDAPDNLAMLFTAFERQFKNLW